MRKEAKLSFVKIGGVEVPDLKQSGSIGSLTDALEARLPKNVREGLEELSGTEKNVITIYMAGKFSAESVARSASGLAANPSASPSTRLPNVGTAAIVKPGSATVPTVPPASSAKYPILEKYQTLQGNARSMFWDKNKSELIAEMRAAHAENQSR